MIIGFTKKLNSGHLKGWTTDFEKKILNGTKRHTIRKAGKRNFREGMMLQLSHGVRTKHYYCFLETECSQVQTIVFKSWNAIHPELAKWGASYYEYDSGFITIELDYKKYLTLPEMESLAINDGFDNLEDFFKWFDVKKGEHFIGELIHWKHEQHNT